VPKPQQPKGSAERSYSDDWEPGSEKLDLTELVTEKEHQLLAMREIAHALGNTLDLDELLQITPSISTSCCRS